MSLESDELSYLKSAIRREPTDTELQIVAAEWSEHCSYKSSKIHLKSLPMTGPLVLSDSEYDSGVLDVGDGYVVTVHIESHNHPSAVEPYGGAATGVGGVVRDILSAGTRPIAVLDGLRFGDIKTDSHARWLFKNAVAGIADYGNCLGIPTIGGEIEFDDSFANYALVDVAAIGFGKKDKLIRNRATTGDIVVLLGGPTGRDGIGGSQFASDSLDSADRSAVQIPDPFVEKLIIEAVLEARNKGLIHAMKDLGGGGLSCAISETADALSVGIELDVDMVHTREHGMSPQEIMVSESQERMLIITPPEKLQRLKDICKKFRIRCSDIGRIKSDGLMRVTSSGQMLAELPAGIVANARLLDRRAKMPAYLQNLADDSKVSARQDLSDILNKMLSCPNIASKSWAYEQYDHEVGIRTVVKPGYGAAVLRLDNGKYLAAKLDGNPMHCYLDPYNGAAGCLEEACRNIVCTGARPIGLVDHLQFGSPEDPGVFWTFLESLRGISEYAKYLKIPCVGGKVSFYNETPAGPIKPTPLIGVLGLTDSPLRPTGAKPKDMLLVVGKTHDELGGSEYLEKIHGLVGGTVPHVDFAESKKNMDAILSVIDDGLVRNVHDCSKGGLAVAVSELCMTGNIGCNVTLDSVPGGAALSCDRLLFSETHSRYLLTVQSGDLDKIKTKLDESHIAYETIGEFGGDQIAFERSGDQIRLRVDKAQQTWQRSLEENLVA